MDDDKPLLDVSYTSRRMMSGGGNSENVLINALSTEIPSWSIDEEQTNVNAISKKAASVVEFFYYNHPFEVKVAFAFCAWFYIDDIATQSSLEQFQRNALLGKAQPPGPLAHFQSALCSLYTHWDPLCANFIVCGAMEFMSGTSLYDRMSSACPSTRPPQASHDTCARRAGWRRLFSCAAFPRAAHPEISAYIQALPEIDEYLCLVNDILSAWHLSLAKYNFTGLGFTW
ncbi:hypothetical protein FB451DRAFT_1556196 [Mycena latifolia]|nr:hypothetical protein FB451DRAFT_1556196 [Mycena latifolia]